ncbi:MAG: integrase core domain-containing protein [Candidatus Lariskella arthropodorum]
MKFRPIRPASPHLNGKVERSQRTDLDEFYSSINIKDADLSAKLQQWEEYYNRHRSHSSLKGKTPWETFQTLQTLAHSQAEIEAAYNPANKPYALQNYKYEQKLTVLKNKYNAGKLQLNLTSKM